MPGRCRRNGGPAAPRTAICALIYNDKQWTSFLQAIDQEDLPKRDPRFASFAIRIANIDHVYGELGRIFAQRSTADWLALLERPSPASSSRSNTRPKAR